MNHTERSTEIQSLRTGLSATLRVLLRLPGSGAPSSTIPSRRGVRPRRVTLAPLALMVALAALLVAPASSFAAFTRPFLRQITRAENPSGLSCSTEPQRAPSCFGLLGGGLATDHEGNLWVGDGEEALGEFTSSSALSPNAFREAVTLEETPNEKGEKDATHPESLAIDHSTGQFYVTGEADQHLSAGFVEVFGSAGKLCRRWSRFSQAHVAVDNSSEPLSGPVYVAHGDVDPGTPFGDGLQRGVEKFDVNASCEPTPAPFTFSATYIEGNQIVGSPNGKFNAPIRSPVNVTVDSHGNIYVVGRVSKEGSVQVGSEEVDEYEASGRFVRAITGEATPGLGASHSDGGWGAGRLSGVAVDPVSGDVLVGLSEPAIGEGAGAVDEFDSSGRFLKQITATEIEVSKGMRQPGRLRDVGEMTVDSQGDLYAADRRHGSSAERVVDVYGPGHLLPDVKISEAGERTRTTAVVNGSVDPEGLALSECYFEYVGDETFEKSGFSTAERKQCVPNASEIVPSSKYTPVQAHLTGLTSGVTYRYRLVATTAGGLGGLEASTTFAFTTPHAPRIASTSASNLSSTFADLHAQIEPLGAATSYHFEYDTSEYTPGGAPHGTSVPVPDADIGAGGPTGSTEASVVRQIGGLVPGTTYHFRVVARNEVEGATEVEDGPDRAFTTLAQGLPGLPDGRAYELVTPANKGSSSDLFTVDSFFNQFSAANTGYPADSGDGFLLEAGGAEFGSFPSAGIFNNTYALTRTAPASDGLGGGWTYASLPLPSLGVQQTTSALFDPARLSRVAFGDSLGSSVSQGAQRNMVLLGPPGGPYTSLYSGEPGEPPVEPLAASHDLNHVVLGGLNHTLAPGGGEQDEGSEALYEWEPIGVGGCTGSSAGFSEGARGCLALVNVNSEGSLLNRCGAELGQSSREGRTHNAISADGSKEFFTAPDPSLRYHPTSKETREATQECWDGAGKDTPQLYVRTAGQTLEVSKPEEGVSDPSGRHPAVYVGASEDGSKVFFFTETELTSEAVALKLHDPELYECEIFEEAGTPECRLTRISAGEVESPAREPGGGGHIFQVPAISADGSAVYFTAFGALAPEAQTLKEEAREQAPVNLYRYDTVSGKTVYVARIREQNYPNQEVGGSWWGKPAVETALNPKADWYTTPDGRYLLFGTEMELTGYSTVEASRCPAVDQLNDTPDGHCTELYRYHYEPGSASGGSVVCVSCDPSGSQPVSNAVFAADLANRERPDAGPRRAMSNDGSYVFFDTADPLVSADTDKTLEVYEWEAQGRGGCELATGCVHLISPGKEGPSYFLGMSPDGSNAFFGTHANLVPQDIDTYGDLYDARICEAEKGNPCIKPPVGETAQCEGDACQHLPQSPIDATPTSVTFSGAGNVRPAEKTVVKPRPLTRAQRLQEALKACKRKPKSKRAACRAQARRRYGARSGAKRSGRARHASSRRRAGR